MDPEANSKQGGKKSSKLGWIILILFLLNMVLGSSASAFTVSRLLSFRSVFGESVAGYSDQGGTGMQSACPDSQIQVLLKNRNLWDRINANMATYKSAAQSNHIPWEMLAALHYREHGLSTSNPRNGEGPYQMTDYGNALRKNSGALSVSYQGRNRIIGWSDIQDFTIASDLAANILQLKSKNKLSASPSDAVVKDAFWGYNGRAYGAADNSPYVMNHFDSQHNDMRIKGWITNEDGSRFYVNNRDTADGAFTVYYLLRYQGEYDGSGRLTGFKVCQEPGGANVAAGNSLLSVPAVVELTSGDCGQASILMAALYYNPQLSSRYVGKDASGRYQTKDDISVVTPEFLNNHTKGSSRYNGESPQWRRANPAPSVGVEIIKKSLASGDPVVFFGKPGLIYDSQHIFVITGYDSANRAFYVNNPYVGGCQCAPSTTKPNGKLLTEDRIQHYFGGHGGPYGSSMIIRAKYL